MVKSLEEFNRDFEYRLWLREKEEDEREASPRSKTLSAISSTIFYFVIAAMVLTAFIYSQNGGEVKNLFGYSYFNILTTSMQSELPAGSFIWVKSVDAATIEIGDDITFFKSEGVVVTHRVIDIIENYDDSGQLGFQTQGVDNLNPDEFITYEENIIGKVLWHIPVLGFVLEYIANHVVMILVLFGVLILIAFFLGIFFSPDDDKKRKADEDQIENIAVGAD